MKKEYSDRLREQIINAGAERIEKWQKKRIPLSVHFELTSRCNFNCIHCYMQKVHDETELTTKQIELIIDKLYDIGVLFITITGGEVLTRSDFKEIYVYMKKKGFIVELFTNGYLLNDTLIEVLIKYPPLLVDVSLYGACEETYFHLTGIHGAYDRVINNCKRLKESGLRVAIKSPITTLTFEEIESMRQIAESLNIPFRCSFEMISTIDNDYLTKEYQVSPETILKYEYNEYLDSNEDSSHERKSFLRDRLFYCKVGHNSFVIDYQGKITPCMKFRHRAVDFLSCDFFSLWQEYGQLTRIKLPETHKCYHCDAAYYCDNCPAEMESAYGDMFEIDPIKCYMAHERLKFHKEHNE